MKRHRSSGEPAAMKNNPAERYYLGGAVSIPSAAPTGSTPASLLDLANSSGHATGLENANTIE